MFYPNRTPLPFFLFLLLSFLIFSAPHTCNCLILALSFLDKALFPFNSCLTASFFLFNRVVHKTRKNCINSSKPTLRSKFSSMHWAKWKIWRLCRDVWKKECVCVYVHWHVDRQEMMSKMNEGKDKRKEHFFISRFLVSLSHTLTCLSLSLSFSISSLSSQPSFLPLSFSLSLSLLF